MEINLGYFSADFRGFGSRILADGMWSWELLLVICDHWEVEPCVFFLQIFGDLDRGFSQMEGSWFVELMLVIGDRRLAVSFWRLAVSF